jgi:hypothetical protein
MASRRESIQVERWSALADIVGHARSEIERLSRGLGESAPRVLVDRLSAIESHLSANPYSHECLYEAMLMMRELTAPLTSLVTAIAAGRHDAARSPNGPP